MVVPWARTDFVTVSDIKLIIYIFFFFSDIDVDLSDTYRDIATKRLRERFEKTNVKARPIG